MAEEIERKFLVCGEYRKSSVSHARIVQGYIVADKSRTVRVRRYGERAYLTIKGPSSEDGLSRMEIEKEITTSEAEVLFPICLPGIIDKIRYLVPCGSKQFEVDEFHGDNEGLVVAEIELMSPDEPFDKPTFLGREVTGDVRYYNSYLSRHPFVDWDK